MAICLKIPYEKHNNVAKGIGDFMIHNNIDKDAKTMSLPSIQKHYISSSFGGHFVFNNIIKKQNMVF